MASGINTVQLDRSVVQNAAEILSLLSGKNTIYPSRIITESNTVPPGGSRVDYFSSKYFTDNPENNAKINNERNMLFIPAWKTIVGIYESEIARENTSWYSSQENKDKERAQSLQRINNQLIYIRNNIMQNNEYERRESSDSSTPLYTIKDIDSKTDMEKFTIFNNGVKQFSAENPEMMPGYKASPTAQPSPTGVVSPAATPVPPPLEPSINAAPGSATVAPATSVAAGGTPAGFSKGASATTESNDDEKYIDSLVSSYNNKMPDLKKINPVTAEDISNEVSQLRIPYNSAKIKFDNASKSVAKYEAAPGGAVGDNYEAAVKIQDAAREKLAESGQKYAAALVKIDTALRNNGIVPSYDKVTVNGTFFTVTKNAYTGKAISMSPVNVALTPDQAQAAKDTAVRQGIVSEDTAVNTAPAPEASSVSVPPAVARVGSAPAPASAPAPYTPSPTGMVMPAPAMAGAPSVPAPVTSATGGVSGVVGLRGTMTQSGGSPGKPNMVWDGTWGPGGVKNMVQQGTTGGSAGSVQMHPLKSQYDPKTGNLFVMNEMTGEFNVMNTGLGNVSAEIKDVHYYPDGSVSAVYTDGSMKELKTADPSVLARQAAKDEAAQQNDLMQAEVYAQNARKSRFENAVKDLVASGKYTPEQGAILLGDFSAYFNYQQNARKAYEDARATRIAEKERAVAQAQKLQGGYNLSRMLFGGNNPQNMAAINQMVEALPGDKSESVGARQFRSMWGTQDGVANPLDYKDPGAWTQPEYTPPDKSIIEEWMKQNPSIFDKLGSTNAAQPQPVAPQPVPAVITRPEGFGLYPEALGRFGQ
jgi:hypothetical protein